MIAAQRLDPPVRQIDMADGPQLDATRLWQCDFLSREEQQALRSAVLPAKSVRPHTDLVREADRAGSLFIVVDGWACRYATTSAGARQLSAVLVPGDVGNLDTLMFDRLDYGVRTLTQATIVALPRDRALALGTRYPGIGQAFTWLALMENAVLGKWALSLGRRSSIERLAHLLCELSVRLGAEKDNQSSFAFPLTQEQLADMLGLTPVHVNRTIQQLRAADLIVNVHRAMMLPDVARLRYLGGFDPAYLRVDRPARANIF